PRRQPRTRTRRNTKQVETASFADSPVDFPKHDVDRTEDRRDIGKHVALADKVHRLEMSEAWRPNLAAIRLVGPVGDEVDTELTLGRLDSCVNLAGRHVIAFCVEFEVMDQRLH